VSEISSRVGAYLVRPSIPTFSRFYAPPRGNEKTDHEIVVGITLKETRRLANLTQRQLSQLTGIPQRQLSAIEQGKCAVDKQLAKQLAKVLEVDYRVFFNI